MSGRRLLSLILASALTGLAGAQEAPRLPDIGSSAGSAATPAEMREYGASMLRELRSYNLVFDDPLVSDYLDSLGYRLVAHSEGAGQPFTFFVVRSNDINAFAAPGGYVLVTRGLYQLLADDSEVAAVLGHEIGHVVQRDHYNVIRKQMMSGTGIDIAASHVNVGGGLAGSLVKDYMREHGAAVMATSLDRGAEYHADHASAIYLARSGSSPLALYGVLQKMSAVGTKSPEVAQLYRTHPPLDQRMDRLDRDPIAMKQ